MKKDDNGNEYHAPSCRGTSMIIYKYTNKNLKDALHKP